MSLNNLITDRTANDVEIARNYQGKQWSDLTAEQKAEYLLGLKGAYSYIDLNRVENAVSYLSDLLNSFGYRNVVNIKDNWQPEDMMKVSEIQRYIDNIAEIKNKYYSTISGTLPTTFTWITLEHANYIESLLLNIEKLITYMQNRFVYCGVCNCGQNRVWQQRFRQITHRRKRWIDLTEIYWNEFTTETWEDIGQEEE